MTMGHIIALLAGLGVWFFVALNLALLVGRGIRRWGR